MNQIVTHNGREYRMDGRAYQMLAEHPDEADGDSFWWEYRVDFSDAQTGAARLEWDSFHETYSGSGGGGRFTQEEAEGFLETFLKECADPKEPLMAELFPEK